MAGPHSAHTRKSILSLHNQPALLDKNQTANPKPIVMNSLVAISLALCLALIRTSQAQSNEEDSHKVYSIIWDSEEIENEFCGFAR